MLCVESYGFSSLDAWYFILFYLSSMAVPVQTRVVVGARQYFVLGAIASPLSLGKGIMQSEDQVPGS